MPRKLLAGAIIRFLVFALLMELRENAKLRGRLKLERETLELWRRHANVDATMYASVVADRDRISERETRIRQEYASFRRSIGVEP